MVEPIQEPVLAMEIMFPVGERKKLKTKEGARGARRLVRRTRKRGGDDARMGNGNFDRSLSFPF